MFAIATINALATKVGSNNLGVIENTLGLFKISFGVSEFSAGLKGKSAVQTGGKCLCKRERDVG